jgi:cell division protein FtsQ
VVEHLSRSLPEQVKRRRPQLIDLSDPEQPELSLPGAVKTPAKAERGRTREQPAGSLGRLPTANPHRPLPSCPIRVNLGYCRALLTGTPT